MTGSKHSSMQANTGKGTESMPTTIQSEIAIAASPEVVWEFLVDPERETR